LPLVKYLTILVKSRSLVSIDILRAIAVLGVFFYHQHIGSLIVLYTVIPVIGWIDNFGASYAVPLFFLISGYCIHLSNLKYMGESRHLPLNEYYKRRFKDLSTCFYCRGKIFQLHRPCFMYHNHRNGILYYLPRILLYQAKILIKQGHACCTGDK
jgi:hypothetical protein